MYLLILIFLISLRKNIHNIIEKIEHDVIIKIQKIEHRNENGNKKMMTTWHKKKNATLH